MLLANQLTFTYDKSPLLDNINTSISPGEIVGLPGRSGCGKTTLGLILAGILRPSEGHIICDDTEMTMTGYCPVQLIYQHPELAVNPRWEIRRTLIEGNTEYIEFFTKFGLKEELLERYPHELSGGELQRISLIRIMNGKTRYIIADEITASLDANNQAIIWTNLIPWARKQGVGILAISHDTKLLHHICDRIDNTFESEAV